MIGLDSVTGIEVFLFLQKLGVECVYDLKYANSQHFDMFSKTFSKQIRDQARAMWQKYTRGWNRAQNKNHQKQCVINTASCLLTCKTCCMSKNLTTTWTVHSSRFRMTLSIGYGRHGARKAFPNMLLAILNADIVWQTIHLSKCCTIYTKRHTNPWNGYNSGFVTRGNGTSLQHDKKI